MDLLRFITCGSVDDGKSTLIGRLLFDSQAIHSDMLESLEQNRVKSGADRINLALLTDGLKAEREQGITIDVAYKYFSTPGRKFIIADTPGHIQYTRNMVTGASNAQLAILLVDARNGIVEQTRRHSYIASLLGIPHLVLCVNKMDLVDYSREVFERIAAEFSELSGRMGVGDAVTIPMSALEGDNVVDHSQRMDWYTGPSLLEHLESAHVEHDENLDDARLPVQYVIRPQSEEFHDFRGYAGRVASGIFEKGDEVLILPSNRKSRVTGIYLLDQELDQAFAPQSITMTLADDIDISRGDMIAAADNPPGVAQEFRARVCWMAESELRSGQRYLLQHTTQRVTAKVTALESRTDIHTLEEDPAPETLGLNDLGTITVKTGKPLFFDPYRNNRRTGSFILIDEGSNTTVAAGMIEAEV